MSSEFRVQSSKCCSVAIHGFGNQPVNGRAGIPSPAAARGGSRVVATAEMERGWRAAFHAAARGWNCTLHIAHCTLISAIILSVFASLSFAEEAPAETFASVMKEAQRLRNEKKRDESVAKAQHAIDIADKPDDKAQGFWFVADNYWSDRKPDVRQEENLLKALAVEGITPGKRSFLVKDIVNKYYRNKGDAGFEKAKELIESTLAMPATSNALDRIELTKAIANLEFSRFVVDNAETRLADLEKMPNLTKQNQCDIYFARANMAKKKKDYAEAAKQLARIHTDPTANSNQRMNAFNEATGLLMEDLKFDEVIAMATKYMTETSFVAGAKEANLTKRLVPAYLAKKDYKAAHAAADALMKLEMPNNYTKDITLRAYRSIKLSIFSAENNIAGAKAFIIANAEFVNGWGETLDIMKKFFARGDYAGMIEVADVYWPGFWPHQWAWGPLDDTVVAYWRLGNIAGAADFIEKELAMSTETKKIDEKQNLGHQIVLKYLRNSKKLSNGDIKSVLGNTDGNIAKEALSIAGKLLVRFGLIDEPRLVYDYRQSLFVQHKRNIAAVRYVKNAPTDFGSWQASGLMTEKEKHVCDMKIGKAAAERLITDVAVVRGDAVNGDSKGEVQSAAWFWVCYDEYGIHLLFENCDPRFDEVLTGKIGSTDYEMYFGIEGTGPAYQFGVNPTKREFDYCPAWNSPHKYFRLLADYADFSSRPSTHGYATAMNISWELAYHTLPDNGTEWPFEMIHWSRNGGLTWGGTDIWQRSNWGHWKFEGLTPQVKTAIYRVLIYKALARYNGEKNIARGGVIATWQDKELGDPAFYDEVLMPIVEKLDAYAEEANSEMNDATVNKLFKEAVPWWYDFRHYSDELRAKYLTDKLTE